MARMVGMLTFPEPRTKEKRDILHVDMDAFFASIEQRDHPELRGKPVIIARHPKENSGKGVVSTASYEARKYGVHSAMSAQEAYERCPNGIFVRGHHAHYREVSEQVRAIFRRYTDLIEPLSIDEAFLDVTNSKKPHATPLAIAQEIQATIFDELQLTCSIGVSYNKFIAKIASDYHKPNGITVIPPERAQAFIDQLAIKDIYGIGKHSEARLAADGIETGHDLRMLSQEDLLHYFGKGGLRIYERVRGVDNRPIRTTRIRKSIGKETTLFPYVYDEEAVSETLRKLSRAVAKHVAEKGMLGRIVTVKIRYADFSTYTRQTQLSVPIADYEDIYFHAQRIWDNAGDVSRGVRLIGVTLGQLASVNYEPITLPLSYEERTDDV